MPRKKPVAEPIEEQLEAEVEEALSGVDESEDGYGDEDEDIPPAEFEAEDLPDEDSDDAEDEGDTGRDYEVLYTRFRPNSFASVIGQEHATKPIRDKIAKDQVPHALLMAGDRGCGKTTTARLIAMALNCETRAKVAEDRLENPKKFKGVPVDPEPCGKCNVCRSVISGKDAIGIEELDAATNRGIGDIKALIEKMKLGSLALRKVYIIDEVHQLGKDAVSALLKTMEEPPKGVIIILCTTDPDKIPETIRSRVTTYRFRTLDTKTMTGLVKSIAKRAKMKLTEAEIQNVVKQGRGSPRDTLSAMESIGGNEDATNLNNAILEASEALADNKVTDVLIALSKAVNNGVAPQELGSGLIGHFKNCLMSIHAPDLVIATDEEAESIAIVARKLKSAKIVRLLKELTMATGKMSYSGDARVLLETTLISVVIPEANDGILGVMELLEEALDKMDDMEKVIAQLSLGGVATSSSLPEWDGVDPPKEKPKKSAPVEDESEDEADEADEADDEPEVKPKSKTKKTKGKSKKSEPEDEPEGDEDEEEDEAPAKSKKSPKKFKDSDLEDAKELLKDLLDDADEDGKRNIVRTIDDAIAEDDLEVEAWIDEGEMVFTIESTKEVTKRLQKATDKKYLVEWLKDKNYELELKEFDS